MKNRFSKNYLISASAGLLAGLLMQPAAAAPLSLSNIPLIVAVSSEPNMMFIFDTSGSMNHIVVDKPYDASTTYGNCPSSKALGNSTTYYLVNSSGTAKIGNASGTPSWTNNTEGKCFNPSLTYQASLIAPSDSGLANALRSFPNSYSGNYLNWYFSNTDQSGPNTSLSSINITSSITGVRRSDAKTRMEVAKTALSNLISNSLSHINVGLTTFDSSGGGANVVVDLDKIDTGTHKTNLLNQISGLGALGGTPLTSTLAQVGRYFVKSDGSYYDYKAGNEGAAIHTLFNVEPKVGEADKDYISGSCQKSFIVTMTDGEPSDTDTNYNTAQLGKWVDNASSTSDDFDDVAAAMFDIDFKYTGTAGKPDDFKNNIINYTIGFELNTPLLDRAAALGGGKYFTVNNSTDLSKAFEDASSDIIAISGSMSSIAFNSSQLEAGSAIYQAKFDSGNWFGALEALPLNNQGVIGSASWEAGALLNSMTYTNRKIFSYDKTTLKDGIPFAWANMNTAQKDDLRVGVDSNNSGSVDDTDAQALLAYLNGDRSKEGYSSTHYRKRDSLLGDLINSAPIYVGKPQMNWPEYVDNNLFGSSSNSYSAYKTNNTVLSRTPMVYVGGNDGMLHGFGAALTGTDAGKELFAYVPGLVYSSASKEGLHYLASQSYDHKFYVDLTPSVSDAFIKTAPTGSADWRTVLIGGLQAGGKGLFALDVTNPSLYSNPSNYADDIALWEFDGSATPTGSADMGYVFGTPTVAMMANGKWAVVSPNGYNSSNGHAVLMIIYLEGGLDGAWTATSDYIAIDTGVGGSGNENGLSTPRLVDFNGDKVVDMIYAGDLKGNMWAFDVSSASSGSWTSRKLFTAVNSDGIAQPITSGPVIALNPNAPVNPTASNPNLLVMFGTGKYLETTDNTSTTKMSYYAVWDKGSANLTRSSLEPRTLITKDNPDPNPDTRSVSGNAIDWSTQYGWYMDLLDKSSATATPVALGERVVADSLLRRSVLFFNTIIVNSEDCTNSGSGWLMSLQYDTGLAPGFGVFDGNNDGKIDSSDIGFVGEKFTEGLPAKSGILGEKQYTPGTNGKIKDRKIYIGSGSREGRLSWHELFRN